MTEYQITFLVTNTDTSAKIIKPFHHLSKNFKSTLTIINISRNRHALLSNSLAILQVGLIKGDFCQLNLVGIDAELACFVIKNFIAEHYRLIESNGSYQFCNYLGDRLPELDTPSKVKWHYKKAQSQLTKQDCLNELAQLMAPNSSQHVVQAFTKREQSSSTYIKPGVAIPHIMMTDLKHVIVAVMVSPSPINWTFKNDNVHLIIAIMLPNKATHEQLNTASNLTRNLLFGQVAERLLKTKNSIDLQALLMHCMSKVLN